MLNILYVGIGGFMGSVLRYLVAIYASKLLGTQLPFGTLIVNIVGGIFIGLIMTISLNSDMSPELRLFLTTGLMGGLTTFSAFSYETVSLFSQGSYWLASLNIGLNLSLSLGGVILGKTLFPLLVHGS